MLVDILVLTIITISIISCFKKGFALSLFNSLSSISSVIIMAFFYKPFVAYIKASPMGVKICDDIRAYVEKELLARGTQAIESSDMPMFLKGFMYTQTDSASVAAIEVADKIFSILVTVVAFVVLVLAIKILLHFIPKILKFIMKLPVLSQFDKLLGIGVGVILGAVWSVVGIYAVGLLSLIPNLEILDEQLANSFFLMFLNNLNIGLF